MSAPPEESGAVVAADGANDDLRALTDQVTEQRQKQRTLELTLIRREAELRRAREERALMDELQTVNRMALRKMNAADPDSKHKRLSISDENLARIVALEDAIKQEDKKTRELKREAALIERNTKVADDAIAKKESLIAVVKDVTGYEQSIHLGHGYADSENRFHARQIHLAELESQQQTLKNETLKLTKRLEELSADLEKRKSIEEEIFKSQAILKAKGDELHELQDDVAEKERLLFRKDKLLQKESGVDEHKRLKLLEGEKRVLQAELQKNMELVRVGEKTLLAEHIRLQQLKNRIQAVSSALVEIFGKTTDSKEHRPDVPEGATEVPVARFEEFHQEILNARFTLAERDDQLEELDRSLEKLESNIEIMQNAKVSRTAIAAQEYDELEYEKRCLEEHIKKIDGDFADEEQKLKEEKAALEKAQRKLNK